MTSHQLAHLLLLQPDVPVFNYVQEAEEYGETTNVVFYRPEDKLPYAKSDQPDNDKGIILVEGWCM